MSQDKQSESLEQGKPKAVASDCAEAGDCVEPPPIELSGEPVEGCVGDDGGGGCECHIEVIVKVDQPDSSLCDWLKPKLGAILPIAGVNSGEVNVLVVDDAVMSKMHERYKQVVGRTDVLSFDMRESESDPVEADLVVCFDEAARQAAERGHEIREELLLYAVHGLLHMLGYDDHDKQEAALMHRREDELLCAVGLGAIYGKKDEQE